jgi:hypothetical protein
VEEEQGLHLIGRHERRQRKLSPLVTGWFFALPIIGAP